MELNKYNIAIRTNKLDAFEADVITKHLENNKGRVIDKGGRFLQFKDDEYQLVSMTTRIIVGFNEFKKICLNG